MSENLMLVLTGCLAAMVVELIYRGMTRSGALLPRLVAVLLAGGVVYELAPGQVQQMGGLDETVSIGLCYVSMLLGMVAQYFYAQAERGGRRFRFNLMTFLMPIFASPIVFIPLLTLTSELGGGGAFTRAKLMVYLVAFQNGFFWRTFFEQRQKEIGMGA
jgi:hypothetical protein